LRGDPDEAEERIENVVELIGASAKYAELPLQEAMLAFLQEVALISEIDEFKTELDVVTLITLHAAKGLEFRNVFIAGFEEELCPHVRSFADPVQMEEERRLAYVGITRAQDRLFLSYARFRGGWGSRSRVPSRFLQDIPDDVLDRDETESTGAIGAPVLSTAPVKSTTAVTERSYRDGEKVRHPVFGIGIVISGKIGSGGEEVQVAFSNAGIKLLSAAFANLERL
jgi:DNA helicase-2/ATP-dependent DNA helicase PcrA